MNRAQSSVVGVALLVGLAIVSIAGMTVAVGTVFEDRAAAAGADRVAAGFDGALDPNGLGPERDRIATPNGQVRVVERTLRLRVAGRTVATYEVGGLVYATTGRRVTYLTGSIARSNPASATVHGEPFVRTADGELFVSVVALGAAPGRAVDSGAVVVRTNVSHERRELRPRDYRVAVETRSAGAWAERLESIGRTSRRDFDGDGVPSVVVDPPGGGAAHLVIHRLGLEVSPA